MEPYNHEKDQELLGLLMQPNRPALPPAIQAEADPLGLAEFKNPQDAVAEQIFYGFSYICCQIAQNNPHIRAQFANGNGPIEFPIVSVGDFHRFGLRWFDDKEGRSTYELYRADKGNPNGGFFAIQNTDGSVILTRELGGGCTDENYPEMLGAAQKALLIYAVKSNVPLHNINSFAKQDYMNDQTVRLFVEQAKKEQKPYYKTWNQAKSLTGRVGNTVYGIFTKEVSSGMRKLAIGRIALAAVLLPLPGYSEGLFDSPVLRPASFELAADAGTALIDAATPEKKPDLEALYDTEQLDLPAEALVANSERPLAVIAPVDRVGNYEVVDFINTNASLHGTSPRRVRLREDLRPNSCQRLAVAPATQSNNLLLATTNSRMSGKLTVESTGAGIFVCNTTKEFIDNDQADIVFDSSTRVN